jgi:hypothetical protein
MLNWLLGGIQDLVARQRDTSARSCFLALFGLKRDEEILGAGSVAPFARVGEQWC